MKQPLLAAAVVCVLLAGACSSSDTPSTTRTTGTRAAAPSATGAYAFPRTDAPYEAIVAEARRTGRPALLFFWTSW